MKKLSPFEVAMKLVKLAFVIPLAIGTFLFLSPLMTPWQQSFLLWMLVPVLASTVALELFDVARRFPSRTKQS